MKAFKLVVILFAFTVCSVYAQDSVPEKSLEDVLPPYTGELSGRNEARIKNPNNFSVVAGIRRNEEGINIIIPPHSTVSKYIPNGSYEIYFVYSNDAESLYKGDNFTMLNNGIEIQLVGVVNGNYGIQKVR